MITVIAEWAVKRRRTLPDGTVEETVIPNLEVSFGSDERDVAAMLTRALRTSRDFSSVRVFEVGRTEIPVE